MHAYYARKGSKLDAGIALAYLYVANPEVFTFEKTDVPERNDFDYVGAVTIIPNSD